jgi:hypothetical protein
LLHKNFQTQIAYQNAGRIFFICGEYGATYVYGAKDACNGGALPYGWFAP